MIITKENIVIFVTRKQNSTALPAKSDSDVMFCLQSYQGLMIDRSLVDRINTQVIYRFTLAQVAVQVNVCLTIVNKRLRHCHSLLARQ